MHFRRLASFLVGAWLAASVFMDAVAIQNFRSVDRLLNAPGPLAAQQVNVLGKTNARSLLRHHAGEINQFLFEQWEYVELAIGLILLLVLILGEGSPGKATLAFATLMLCAVAVDRFWLTPQVSALGRQMDYPDAASANAAAFWRLHGVYSGLELIKLALGIGVAGMLLVRRTDRKRFVREYPNVATNKDGKSV